MILNFCQHCPRRTKVYPGRMGTCDSSGSDDSPILMIGMAPGKDELGNEPFVGKSGARLWITAKLANIYRPSCRLINVTNCWPCAGGRKANKLSLAQIAGCWNRFNEEVSRSKARIVICFGGDAFERLTGIKTKLGYKNGVPMQVKSGIEAHRGYMITPSECRAQEVSLPVAREYKTSRKCSKCKGVEGQLEPLLPDGGSDQGQTKAFCIECNGRGYRFKKGDVKYVRESILVEPVLPPNCEYIIGTYHPSYVERSGGKVWQALINDLDRASRALRGKAKPKRYVFATSPRQLDHNGMVAFDIENAGGLDGPIDRMGMAGESGIWTSDWNQAAIEAARYELGDPDRIKVPHNMQHDVKHLEAEGIEVPGRIFDTMWAAMMLEPDLPMGLRNVASLYLDLSEWKDKANEDPEFYNAHDAGITYDLAKAMRPLLADRGMLVLAENLIMPSLRVLLDMHRTGLVVDLGYLGEWSAKLSKDLLRLTRLWNENVPNIDPSSPDKCKNYLYRTLGLEEVKDPDNEFKPTTAAWAIRYLVHQYPNHKNMLQTLLDIRRTEKLLDCCNLKLGPDGRVHPRIGPHWKDERDTLSKRKGTTSTLRFAVAAEGGLNLQQQPKIARLNYIAPPGFRFIQGDVDRAEPWVYAVMANDESYIHDLTHGDPYQSLANKVGCDRETAKAIKLAKAYGAGATKVKRILMKKEIFVDSKFIKTVLETDTSMYPRVERFKNEMADLAIRQGWLSNGFGFHRNFHGGPKDYTEILNWIAQCPVALILWKRLIPVHEMAKSFGGWLQLTVYDSMMICVPIEAGDAPAYALREIMSSEVPEIADGFHPRVSEIVQGTSWGNLKPMELK